MMLEFDPGLFFKKSFKILRAVFNFLSIIALAYGSFISIFLHPEWGGVVLVGVSLIFWSFVGYGLFFIVRYVLKSNESNIISDKVSKIVVDVLFAVRLVGTLIVVANLSAIYFLGEFFNYMAR